MFESLEVGNMNSMCTGSVVVLGSIEAIVIPPTSNI